MKRPAFQFYPADWRSNAKLRRCSDAARGAWIDVLCVLHDSDEYGVARYSLAELARAAGAPLRLLKELADKDVLKGADKGCTAYTWAPFHAGKRGDDVTLVPASDGPCWYSSRFVRDEYVRQRRGANTRYSETNPAPKTTPKQSPKVGIGEGKGYGASSSSSKEQLPTDISSTHHAQSFETVGVFEGHEDVPRGTHTISAATTAAISMRKAGVAVTGANPDLIAAKAEGVSDEHLLEVVALYPGKPAGYVIAAARREHADRAAPIATGPPRNGHAEAPSKTMQAIQTLMRGTTDGRMAEQRDPGRAEPLALPAARKHAGG